MALNQETLAKTQTYHATASPGEIAVDLNEIAKLDRWAKKKTSQFSTLLVIEFFGCIASIILIFLFIHTLGIALLAVFGIVAIIGVIFTAKYRRLGIPQSRYELSQKLLSMLRRDIPEIEPMTINLVSSNATDKSKLIETKPHPDRRNWKIDFFEDRWLTLEGKFIDGTKFLLTGTEINLKAYGWKRSSSGKSKYKSKSKSKGIEVNLELNYPRKKYGAIQILKSEALEAVKLGPRATLKNLKITDKAIKMSVKMSPLISEDGEELYRAIATMFLSLYQILNLAKQLSKKTTNN